MDTLTLKPIDIHSCIGNRYSTKIGKKVYEGITVHTTHCVAEM